MVRMTATDLARSFSELLDRVANGDEIEVTRRGIPVAVISPPKSRVLSAERFRALLASAPKPDEGFAADVRAARESVGPPESARPS